MLGFWPRAAILALKVALAAAGADFWVAVSLDAEACKWSGTALARIGAAAGTRHEMILQCSLGASLIFTKGTDDDARRALMRGLSLARTLTDFDYQQRAVHKLWLFSLRVTALDEAIDMARDYDEVVRHHDPQSQAVADGLVGVLPRIYRGEHIEAGRRLRRAIGAIDPIECRNRDAIRFGIDLLASASSHLAGSLLSRGLVGHRIAGGRARSIEQARCRDRPSVLCFSLASAAGFVFLSLGELDMVERYGEELITLGEKHALRPFHAAGLCIRGSLATRRTDPNTGVDLLRRGLADLHAAGYLLLYPYFQVELAAALGAVARVDDGLAEINAALHFVAATGHRWFVPETLRVKGELLTLRGQGDPAVIADLFRGSMRLAREQQALYWELSAVIRLAEFLRGQHREEEAHGVLAEVLRSFSRKGLLRRKSNARKMLLGQLSQTLPTVNFLFMTPGNLLFRCRYDDFVC